MHWRITLEAVDPLGDEYRKEFMIEKDLDGLADGKLGCSIEDGKPPTNARGMIAEARGETEEAAIAALHDVIDAWEIRRTDDRRADPTTGFAVPSAQEYAEAMAQVALSRPQRAILTALALADDEGLSDVSLASAAGYKSNASANRAFASAGLLIASYLSLETRLDVVTREHEGTTFLGYRGEPRKDEDPGNWILHAELREAVRAAR